MSAAIAEVPGAVQDLPELENVVYVLTLSGSPEGFHAATIEAGFVDVDQIPQVDGRYHQPYDTQHLLVSGVFRATATGGRLQRVEASGVERGLRQLPILGRLMTAQTGSTALKTEVVKFNHVPNRLSQGPTTRHAVLLGHSTASRFVEFLPGMHLPQAYALRHAFSTVRPQVGELGRLRWY